ncbi:MAG: response regulator [Bdellovibrionota bacterium]
MLTKDNQKVDVLIVDDREDGLMALEAALCIPHINLVKAQSGEEALSYLDKYNFGVLLLDVQMPEMDGFELAEKIRKKEKYKFTPIIFVTAINKDDRYVYKGYELGAVDYIFKPFDAQVLNSKVSIFVELYLKSSQLEKQAEKIRESERKERYQKLAELEIESLKRYRNLANSIPHIIWKARDDGIFNYFNQVWIDYTGLSQDQSVGLGWQSAMYPDDLNQFLKNLILSMNSGEGFEIECRLRRHDGQYRWHWLKASPELQGNFVTAWIGTCTDIHDRKLAETKLIEAEQLAVSASVAKTSFLANMSHEIRTPMNAILGFSELMLNPDQDEEERRHCINTVHKCGRQLLGLIDEILDISKIEAGRMEVEKIDFNLGTLLKDLSALMKVQAESKNLKLEFEFLSKIPEFINTDPTRLRQILVNVIGNAIKFTQVGEVRIKMAWKNEKNNLGSLEIFVSDTGVGIDSEHKNKLFKPFVQADNSTTRVFGGTGLGLFLSRKLARALNGDLTFEEKGGNRKSLGSTFLLKVNTENIKDVKFIQSLPKDQMETKKSTFQSTESQLEGLKILLVEDSEDNQDIITYFLTHAGAHVDIAENGVEGVQKTLEGDYNIVLMDIQMPKMDGYQATSELRNKGYMGPIIALTAHALKEERDRCLKAGYTEHMTKPVNRVTLISEIARFASKSRHLVS